MPDNLVVLINGDSTQGYLEHSLKTKGFVVVHLMVPSENLDTQQIQPEAVYDGNTIHISRNVPQILNFLKALFLSKNYNFSEAIALQEIDLELADTIRGFFKRPANERVLHQLNVHKGLALQRLNDSLHGHKKVEICTIETFSQAMSQQSLPVVVKVVQTQQVSGTYLVSKPSDSASVLAKLKSYDKSQGIELWVQPYYQTLYHLQTTTFGHQTQLVAVWREKVSFQALEGSQDCLSLMDPRDSHFLSQDQWSDLCQKLTHSLQLGYGISEFVVAFEEKQAVVLDYALSLRQADQFEVMERVLGYSPLSLYLRQAALIADKPLVEKKFKNILAVPLLAESKADLLKLTGSPAFYRYFGPKAPNQNLASRAVIYLVHSNKNLVLASYASLRNMERLLLDPQFASHSSSHIVDFYRKAAVNPTTDYLSSSDKSLDTLEQEALKQLSHESQHIPRYVKPLNDKATIQDIMRYYIDIYDLYILHGKPPGTQIIPMNTGNPAFLPFSPIVKALRKSLEDHLLSYARYSMQVPEQRFIDKMAHYCQEEGLLAASRKLETHNVVIGHGSTNLYYLALKSLIKNKGDIVLITRPTYGLFIDPVYTAGGDVGFIDIKESSGWKVLPDNLAETIYFYNHRAFNHYLLNTFVKEYKKFLHFLKLAHLTEDTVPPMPALDLLDNLKNFDSYIEQLNAYIDRTVEPPLNKEELRFSSRPRVRAFYHMNPHNPTGAVYTREDIMLLSKVIQADPDIFVIDDLAHWGVLYGDVEPVTFSSLDYMFDRTLTLMSLSKAYCVPGLRTGVAIGNAEIIGEMQYRLLNSSSSATLPAMIAMDAVLSASKTERDQYLKSNSQEYFFRRNLMATLVNGIHQTKLGFEQKIKIYQLVIENEYKIEKPFDEKLLGLILSGIPLVRTMTSPQGCFFHLLDISKLMGAKIGSTTLTTSTDVRNAIYSICKIDMVPGEISGNFFNYSLRMSFSLSPQQIYDACKSIHLFIGNYIVKQNPSLLLETHAHNPTTLPGVGIELLDKTLFNKAFVRFYLGKMIHELEKKYMELFKHDYLQHKPRLEIIKCRLHALGEFSEGILDPSNENIHEAIKLYLIENNAWLRHVLPEFNQLDLMNDALITSHLTNRSRVFAKSAL